RQGLPFGLEAGDDLATIHARFDDLEGDLALHGLGLLGHEDGAHAAFADLLQELVWADDRAREVGERSIRRSIGSGCRLSQQLASFGMGFAQHLGTAAPLVVAGASLVELRAPLFRRAFLEGFQEYGFFTHFTTPTRPEAANDSASLGAKLHQKNS